MREAGRASPAASVIIAFDYGRRRIGVACGDTVTRSASPQGCIGVDVAGPRWSEIELLLQNWAPSLAVVGLPYNVDGSESPSSVEARNFAAQLEERFSLQVALVDERYSSMEAHERLKAARASGLMRRRVNKGDIDAASACMILERWFTEKI